ncbi:uncharacterized protein LY89DRAFT_280376 [Mollisia scopiformis]|uniref:Uncharacterized protein n=1 Tax=Mollisia scopiformis TaxID=149040 RepID=A0A132B9Y8_MOLSC|nr:uncharacterized protein LY89DRAFT_280376 [Mollisia scopiformis]KUJ09222.1 hypothetical protein LY89DRAFT_280376 [Mollisia scopiformis]
MYPTHTQPPSTEGWYKCCACKETINPDQYPTGCNCGHTKCDECKPLTPPPSPIKDNSRYNMQYNTFNNSASGSRDRTRRPDIRGWWTCCQCQALVNPNVNGDTCPVCAHVRCDWYCVTN